MTCLKVNERCRTKDTVADSVLSLCKKRGCHPEAEGRWRPRWRTAALRCQRAEAAHRCPCCWPLRQHIGSITGP